MGQAWGAWLRDTVIRYGGSFPSHTSYGFECARCDRAGNTINKHFNIIKTDAFKAPARNGELLPASSIPRCGADAVNFRVGTYVPTIITSKVAMLGAVTKEGITDAESYFGNLITRVLVP